MYERRQAQQETQDRDGLAPCAVVAGMFGSQAQPLLTRQNESIVCVQMVMVIAPAPAPPMLLGDSPAAGQH